MNTKREERRNDIIGLINKRVASYVGATVLLVSGVSNARMYSHIDNLNGELNEGIETNNLLTQENDILESELFNNLETIKTLSKEKETLLKEKETLGKQVIEKEDEVSELSKQNKLLKEKNDNYSQTHSSTSSSTVQTQKENNVSSNVSSTESSSGWKNMTVEASAYTLVEHGDKLGGTGLTSTGTVPTAYRTIAVDPKVIPYGSLVKYDGVTYVAEDTGGMIKGNKVDIYMNTLSEALTFGRKNIEISVQVAN